MKKRYILIIHFWIFILLAAVCLLSSDTLLNWLMPGFSDVGSWILLVLAEMVVVLILTAISCIIFIKKQLKSKRT